MAGCQNYNAKQKARSGKLEKRLNCVQINLQHSRLATALIYRQEMPQYAGHYTEIQTEY